MLHYRFILEEPIRVYNPSNSKEKENDDKTTISDVTDGEPPNKKLKGSKKNKPRGQNKSRAAPFKTLKEHNICPHISDATTEESDRKCNNDRCGFIHDRIEFLKIKPVDIGEDCHLFVLTGKCPRGTACRFGSKHLTEEGFNIVDSEKYNAYKKMPPSTKNVISRDLYDQLRKYKYNFTKAEKIAIKNNWVNYFFS